MGWDLNEVYADRDKQNNDKHDFWGNDRQNSPWDNSTDSSTSSPWDDSTNASTDSPWDAAPKLSSDRLNPYNQENTNHDRSNNQFDSGEFRKALDNDGFDDQNENHNTQMNDDDDYDDGYIDGLIENAKQQIDKYSVLANIALVIGIIISLLLIYLHFIITIFGIVISCIIKGSINDKKTPVYKQLVVQPLLEKYIHYDMRSSIYLGSIAYAMTSQLKFCIGWSDLKISDQFVGWVESQQGRKSVFGFIDIELSHTVQNGKSSETITDFRGQVFAIPHNQNIEQPFKLKFGIDVGAYDLDVIKFNAKIDSNEPVDLNEIFTPIDDFSPLNLRPVLSHVQINSDNTEPCKPIMSDDGSGFSDVLVRAVKKLRSTHGCDLNSIYFTKDMMYIVLSDDNNPFEISKYKMSADEMKHKVKTEINWVKTAIMPFLDEGIL